MNMNMPGGHGHGHGHGYGYGYGGGLFGCCKPRTQTFTGGYGNGYGYGEECGMCCCLPRTSQTYTHGYGNSQVGMPGQMGMGMGTIGFGNNMFGGQGFGNGMYGAYRRGCLSSLCGGRRESWNPYRRSRKWCIAGSVLASLLAVGAIILVVYLILQPKSPTFTLNELTVLGPDPNATMLTPQAMVSPFSDFLGRTVQATVSSHNPNDRVGVIYERLDVFASYHDRQFTGRSRLPQSYLPRKDNGEWSPMMSGLGAETREIMTAVEQDAVAGRFFIEIKVEGKLKWKVGKLTTGRYKVFARCPAYVTVVGEVAKFEGKQKCAVDVSL